MQNNQSNNAKKVFTLEPKQIIKLAQSQNSKLMLENQGDIAPEKLIQNQDIIKRNNEIIEQYTSQITTSRTNLFFGAMAAITVAFSGYSLYKTFFSSSEEPELQMLVLFPQNMNCLPEN
jgi:hypothetical protein